METTIAPPPVREPRPVTAERALTGKRLIVAMEDPDMPGMTQHVRDYRAASEVFTDGGRQWVRIVEEVQWYAWTTTPAGEPKPPSCPRAKAWPAEYVWVE